MASVSSLMFMYWAWAVANVLRPVSILFIAMLLWNLDKVAYKVKLTLEGIAYFIFCNDKTWKKPPDPASFFDPILKNTPKEKLISKNIIFIRHGESTWNETFNKGPHRSTIVFVIGFIPNLIKALLYEFYLFATGKMDSWFYDSPMSIFGIQQVENLHKFLSSNAGTNDREKELISILRGEKDAPSSKIVTSCLRRAASTVAASLRGRLQRRPNDSIAVVPALQEISRNPDTLIITPGKQQITASWIEKESIVCDFQAIFDRRFDMSLHKGNKPIDTNGLKRMNEFCKYVFSQSENVIICGGHSIWFRSFFRTFLPHNSEHQAKTKKIVNAGCVGFTLMSTSTTQGYKYQIDVDSITVAYGGFA